MRRPAHVAALAALILVIAGCGSANPTRAAAAGSRATKVVVHGATGLVATVRAVGPVHVAALAVDPSGDLWIGTADSSDSGKDSVEVLGPSARTPKVVLSGQHTVLGLVWLGGSLYVASKGQVVAYSGFDGVGFAAHRTVLTLPSGVGEANQLAVGADGRLLLGVSAPCDHCSTSPADSAAVLAFRPDGTGLTTFASGIRAPVGLEVVPGTGHLLVTMDQRDDLGSKTPGDWLALVAEGSAWGFPDCYGQGGPACAGVPSPLAELDRHAAVSGVAVVQGQLGAAVGTAALVAEWATGVVVRVPLSPDGTAAIGPSSRFLTGIGKPVALVMDGTSLLVGDWTTGRIFRLAPR